jgi:predicted nucleic acid-binding protein
MEQIVSFLLDSNLIIYHLSGSVEASAFIRKNAETVAISAVTRIEVLGFPFPSHEAERNATGPPGVTPPQLILRIVEGVER